MDLSATRLVLRGGIVFIPQLYHDVVYYHLEDPSTASFYRIGYAEYVFVSLLDGHTTFAEALTITAQQLGPSALSQAQAQQVYGWLVEQNLASLSHQPSGRPAVRPNRAQNSPWTYLNPFWLKLPLIQPDRLLSALLPYLGWLFALPSVAAALLLAGFASSTVASQWDRFVDTSEIVFSTGNWGWMIATWVVLKIVHELGHGLACRRYGGQVKEMGIVFILLAPMAYVDVTSAWRFPTKWQRIHVALAGMYLELILASVATIAWSRTESALAAHLLCNLIVMASVTTVLFNLNPLMRFDGYYVLSDVVEIPNLYAEGSQFVQRILSWMFYGTCRTTPRRIAASQWLVGAYGIASALWRVAACASLALAASVLFHGVGIILATLGIVSWFAAPMLSVFQQWPQRFRESPHTVYRAVLVSLFLVGFLTAGLAWVPTPWPVTAPGIVDYQDLAIVRCATEGFVEKVHVHDGQVVDAGEILMSLRNPEIANEYNTQLHDLEQSRIRQRMAVEKRDAAQEQIEARQQMAIEQRLVVSRRRYSGLSVRAPIAGRIMGRTLQQALETYVRQGDELLALGNDGNKELILSVADTSIDEVLPIVGSTVKVRIGSRTALEGMLTRVEPRASLQLEHPALAATAGGPLTVREANTADHRRGAPSVELTEPRYRAVVTLPTQSSQELLCGERGYAAMGLSRKSIGIAMRTWMSQWIEDHTRTTRTP